MGGRPSKPVDLIMLEGKSHRTKAELKQRKEAEQSMLTGVPMAERPEVKRNRVAHKEFVRLNELLAAIGKNDAIYEGVINRYCLLYAECLDFEKKREAFYKDLQELTKDKAELVGGDAMSLAAYYKAKREMQATIINLDKQVQAKRKMLLDIEKENILTIASALRSIPKKPEKKEDSSGLSAFLAKRADVK